MLLIMMVFLVAAQTCVAGNLPFLFSPISPPCGFAGTEVVANAINNRGQVVGSIYCGSDHGFFKDGDTYTFLHYPGSGEIVEPADINISGQIVGRYSNTGFLKENEDYTLLSYPGAVVTEALGINNLGQIVGFYHDGSRNRGYIKDGPVYTGFDYPDSLYSYLTDINDAGDIIGRYVSSITCDPSGHCVTNGGAFALIGGSFYAISPPGAVTTLPRGMNNPGQIVGEYFDGAKLHGFLKDGETYVTIDYPDSRWSFITGINDYGQMVGWHDLGAFLAAPNGTPPAIPEPSTTLILSTGLLALPLMRKITHAARPK